MLSFDADFFFLLLPSKFYCKRGKSASFFNDQTIHCASLSAMCIQLSKCCHLFSCAVFRICFFYLNDKINGLLFNHSNVADFFMQFRQKKWRKWKIYFTTYVGHRNVEEDAHSAFWYIFFHFGATFVIYHAIVWHLFLLAEIKKKLYGAFVCRIFQLLETFKLPLWIVEK